MFCHKLVSYIQGGSIFNCLVHSVLKLDLLYDNYPNLLKIKMTTDIGQYTEDSSTNSFII